jgi:hypothetical protein
MIKVPPLIGSLKHVYLDETLFIGHKPYIKYNSAQPLNPNPKT